MRKVLMWLLCLGLFLIPIYGYAANEWEQDTPLGSSSPSDLDTNIQNYITEPLERMLFTYRSKAKIVYASASTLTVEAGEVACRDSGSTLIKMRRNTSSTTVAWADLDTGSEAASTTYYIWAVADADATTFTVKISASATFPTGVTYAAKLGSFYNDSSSNITNIANDHSEGIGEWYDSGWFAVSNNNTYSKTHNLGTTKVLITLLFSNNSNGSGLCLLSAGSDLNGASEYGLYTSALSTTAVTVDTGYTSCTSYNGDPGSYTSGYARIIIVSLD